VANPNLYAWASFKIPPLTRELQRTGRKLRGEVKMSSCAAVKQFTDLVRGRSVGITVTQWGA
jgi:hypothetical protein